MRWNKKEPSYFLAPGPRVPGPRSFATIISIEVTGARFPVSVIHDPDTWRVLPGAHDTAYPTPPCPGCPGAGQISARRVSRYRRRFQPPIRMQPGLRHRFINKWFIARRLVSLLDAVWRRFDASGSRVLQRSSQLGLPLATCQDFRWTRNGWLKVRRRS